MAVMTRFDFKMLNQNQVAIRIDCLTEAKRNKKLCTGSNSRKENREGN